MAKVEQSFEAHTKSINASGVMQSATIPYIVSDAIDEDDALQAVLEVTPQSLNGVPLSSIEISERCNESVYKVDAEYEKDSSGGGSSDDEDDDALDISFSTGGGTKHIQRAIWQDVIWQAKGENFSDKTLIGWNGKSGEEAEYAGVDVPDANIQLTLTAKRKMKDLNTKWQRNIASVTGKVNNKTFHGWEKGEVLFEGVSLSGKEDDENVSVSFNFSIRANEKNVVVEWDENGNPISLNKQGFAYVWAVTKYDQEKEKVVTKGLFGSQVIPYADFSILGV